MTGITGDGIIRHRLSQTIQEKMDTTLPYSLLADMVLVLHALLVACVAAGFVLIVTGMVLRWSWTRNFYFRVLHLLVIAVVMMQAWGGGICPLTEWEYRLRLAAGEIASTEPFVRYWLHRLLFYDFPSWVFTAAYTLLGMIVVLLWILAPPKLSRAVKRS